MISRDRRVTVLLTLCVFSGPGDVLGVGSRHSDLRDVTISASGGTSNLAFGSLGPSPCVIRSLRPGSASEGIVMTNIAGGDARITNSTIQGASASIHNQSGISGQLRGRDESADRTAGRIRRPGNDSLWKLLGPKLGLSLAVTEVLFC